MKDKKICLILNPRSGLSQRQFGLQPADEIIRFFSDKEIPITIKTTSGPGGGVDLAMEAVDCGFTHIVACGGDGTINEVVNGIVGSDATLGVIPMGTENVLCKTLNVPLNVRQACNHFLHAEEKTIDVGRANGRHYVMMSGIGMDARVIYNMEPNVKETLGSVGFFIKGAMALFFENEDVKAEATIELLDKDEKFETTAWVILVGNMPNYAGNLTVVPEAKLDDGFLDILVYSYPDDRNLMAQVISPLMNNFDRKDLRYFKSSHFKITTDPPVFCQIDGEILGKTPVEYKVRPRALKIKI